jgi:hypothetical protein
MSAGPDPGWGGNSIGFMPFPVNAADRHSTNSLGRIAP